MKEVFHKSNGEEIGYFLNNCSNLFHFSRYIYKCIIYLAYSKKYETNNVRLTFFIE